MKYMVCIVTLLVIPFSLLKGMESARHEEKEEARQLMIHYLTSVEHMRREKVDLLALIGPHDKEIEKEVRRSHAVYTAQADTSSIDPVFHPAQLLEREVKTAPLYVTENADHIVLYAEGRILEFTSFPLITRSSIKAFALSSLRQLIYGNRKGEIYRVIRPVCTAKSKTHRKKLAKVTGEIYSLVCHPQEPIVGIRYAGQDALGAVIPVAAVAFSRDIKNKLEKKLRHVRVVDIPDDSAIKEIYFEQDEIITQNFANQTKRWAIDFEKREIVSVSKK